VTARSFAVVLLAPLASGAAAEDCAENLLSGARIVATHGVLHPERIADGRLLPHGWSESLPDAVPMPAGSFVVWDLGVTRDIAALVMQASPTGRFRVLVSEDGASGRPIWEVGPIAAGGVVERGSADVRARARLLRLEALAPGRVVELRAFCASGEAFPPPAVVDSTLPRDASVESAERARAARAPLALLGGVALLALAPRLRRRPRVALAWLLSLAGLASWAQFGPLHAPLHAHDATHYFLGAKYAPELGHLELYRCIARAEQEAGRGAAVSALRVRDLDTYALRPGARFLEPGACRARFTPQRWQAFRTDVDALRGMLGDHGLRGVLRDHGYNATPPQTLWLSIVIGATPASPTALRLLAALDLLALAAVVLAFGWGFGPRAAALCALVIGCGAPWGYEWIGGSLGRFAWLALLALGLAAARRERFALCGAALAGAGLLRLWPFAFLGGLVAWATLRSLRAGRLLPAARSAALGAGLALLVGLGGSLVQLGPAAFRGFAEKMSAHREHVSVNQAGLPPLLSASAQRSLDALRAPELDDPDSLWRQSHRHAREAAAPVAWAIALVGAVLIGAAGWRRRGPVEAIALGGVPVWALLGLSSYDYAWLVALVPLCAARAPRAAALLLVVALSALLRHAFSFELEHALLNAALALLVPGVGLAAALRGWPKRRLGRT
jgi:hypothetical protein